VLGLIRVPLYNYDHDGKGFDSFLKNSFIGCAKEQLLDGLTACKLFPIPTVDWMPYGGHVSDRK